MSQEQGKTSRSAMIRAWLAAHPGPQTSRAIADGLGLGILPVGYSVALMVRDGWLKPIGASKPMSYELLRTEKMVRPRQTEAERSARRRKRERERDQARRSMSPDQYQAWLVECQQRSDAEKAEAQAEALRLQKLAAEIRAANKARAKQQAQRKQEHDAQERRDVARAGKSKLSDAMAGAPAKHDDFPDTEAFIASNPDKLIRLPPGVWSAPLRFTY